MFNFVLCLLYTITDQPSIAIHQGMQARQYYPYPFSFPPVSSATSASIDPSLLSQSALSTGVSAGTLAGTASPTSGYVGNASTARTYSSTVSGGPSATGLTSSTIGPVSTLSFLYGGLSSSQPALSSGVPSNATTDPTHSFVSGITSGPLTLSTGLSSGAPGTIVVVTPTSGPYGNLSLSHTTLPFSDPSAALSISSFLYAYSLPPIVTSPSAAGYSSGFAPTTRNASSTSRVSVTLSTTANSSDPSASLGRGPYSFPSVSASAIIGTGTGIPQNTTSKSTHFKSGIFPTFTYSGLPGSFVGSSIGTGSIGTTASLSRAATVVTNVTTPTYDPSGSLTLSINSSTSSLFGNATTARVTPGPTGSGSSATPLGGGYYSFPSFPILNGTAPSSVPFATDPLRTAASGIFPTGGYPFPTLHPPTYPTGISIFGTGTIGTSPGVSQAATATKDPSTTPTISANSTTVSLLSGNATIANSTSFSGPTLASALSTPVYSAYGDPSASSGITPSILSASTSATTSPAPTTLTTSTSANDLGYGPPTVTWGDYDYRKHRHHEDKDRDGKRAVNRAYVSSGPLFCLRGRPDWLMCDFRVRAMRTIFMHVTMRMLVMRGGTTHMSRSRCPKASLGSARRTD